MLNKIMREALLVTSLLVIVTVIIAASGADLAISSLFCLQGKWPIGNLFPWKALYQINVYPALILAGTGLLASLGSLKWPSWRIWAKGGVFLALLLALGPGLVVNGLFKEGWGRPRPREIIQFEGKQLFLQPWQKGLSGGGRSFPSGHASVAFYMLSPYFIYRQRNKRRARFWLAGGVVFGICMSIARITQGGHFLSDTLWAFGMVYLTALLLAFLLKLDQPPTPETLAV